ncbi:MAG: hypothetical protein R3311_14800 [Oceanisphaera sp.]|nr:hypothetical protein [Oceanisphaera sp.]
MIVTPGLNCHWPTWDQAELKRTVPGGLPDGGSLFPVALHDISPRVTEMVFVSR